ncbi:LysR substrate-binding domain-containing protein [Allomesorhizobium camelthorni]|uniref:LysR family transcriptional regulator n=1 Tax=Allomesorhizobium camelthorni TaxID=475069 RepID=A0A6G4WGI6_9HYPH|nr:LysR substrate-binding domain-containing protein [Mesorhizobium camelthorni]NGO53871.1 LysR family transcriptional regulator [Mesorhizobium camelthorni]
MQRLPSLRALRAFEVAGRRLSFTRASEELNVSQGAISHQINILEQELGFSLFRRVSGGVVLTEKGTVLLAVLKRAFGDIASSIKELNNETSDLRIKVQPAFTARWLLPRLHKFQHTYPDIRLRITTSLDAIDFRNDAFDAAIVTLASAPSGLKAALLMKELLVPVCSPEFLDQYGPFGRPSDLLGHAVIAVKVPNDAKDEDSRSYWRRWLETVGEDGIEPKAAQEYDTLDAALLAATSGFGIAMADYNLIQEELRDMRLLMPFRSVVDQGVGYYLVTTGHPGSESKLSLFKDWVSRELSESPSFDGLDVLDGRDNAKSR